MIRSENLNKIFRQGSKPVHAVRDASFTVSKGERVYVHGPSGAGKSTLLHMLGGLSVPTSGKVVFGEKNVYTQSDAKRSRIRNTSFGFIFQFYHLLPELSVLENVMLPAMIKGGVFTRSIREKAKGLLDIVKMTDRLKHRSYQLSGGEMQRAAIARALINEPEILFCDEPTGNLDSVMAGDIYSLIRDISRVRKMSVIVVSHQEVDKSFFHSEYLMKDGFLSKIADNDISTSFEVNVQSTNQ